MKLKIQLGMCLFLLLFACESTNNKKKQSESNTFTKEGKLNPNIQEEKDSTIRLEQAFILEEGIHCEQINGTTELKEKRNGKIIFVLNDKVEVETTDARENWCQIGVFVKLNAQEKRDFYILPNKNLISETGKIIGKTKDTCQIELNFDNLGQLVAYTDIKNINSNSIPENILETLIERHASKFSSFKQFLSNFNFQKSENNIVKNIEEYYIYENTMDDPSPLDRLSLLFKVGIFIGCYHSRKLNLKGFQTLNLIRGRKLSIIQTLSIQEKIELKKNRIAFYNSVD